MTIRDFVQASANDMLVNVIYCDELLCRFFTGSAEIVNDDILNLEVDTFSVKNQLMKMQVVDITIVYDDADDGDMSAEDEEGEELPEEDETPAEGDSGGGEGDG